MRLIVLLLSSWATLLSGRGVSHHGNRICCASDIGISRHQAMAVDSARPDVMNAFAAFLLSAVAGWPCRPVSDTFCRPPVARSRGAVLQLVASQLDDETLDTVLPVGSSTQPVANGNPLDSLQQQPPPQSADEVPNVVPSSRPPRPQTNNTGARSRPRNRRPDPEPLLLKDPKYLQRKIKDDIRRPPQPRQRPSDSRGDSRPQQRERFTRPDPANSRFNNKDSSRADTASRPEQQRNTPSGPRNFPSSSDKPKAGKWAKTKRPPPSFADRKGPSKRPWKKGRGKSEEDSEMDIKAVRKSRVNKRERRQAKADALEASLGTPHVTLGEDGITVGVLAATLRIAPAEIIKELLTRGMLVSITQTVEPDLAEEIALKFGATVSHFGEDEETEDIDEDDEDDALLVPRPPVVTIMGHVDHGKTTLLDAMRNESVAAEEAGGITQHIGAYSVAGPDGERITFVDTPGHAAFNAMRSRGADTTDIVILVVAADDGVRPQTVESIRAATAAGKPIIVAITKADKPGANAQQAKLDLLENNITLEEFGGDVLASVVSGKTGEGLDDLFAKIALQAEILELKANPDCAASGTVMEAKSSNMGTAATLLVQKGTLKVGDIMVAGSEYGRIRAMLDDTGANLETATPSTAVEVLGLGGLPLAGDTFTVMSSLSEAEELAKSRKRQTQVINQARKLKQSDGIPIKTIDFLVKADVQGSAEAVAEAIEELEVSDDLLRVQTRILKFSAGQVRKEDVEIASVSDAMIVVFGKDKVSNDVARYAHDQGIEIRQYKIIYDALDDLQKLMASFIRPPPAKELGELIGTLEVLQLFKVAQFGKVAGCKVLDGSVRVGSNIRIVRGIKVVYSGKLQSLRYVKDEVDEVNAPNECGISFSDFQLMEPGDRVEVYASKEEEA